MNILLRASFCKVQLFSGREGHAGMIPDPIKRSETVEIPSKNTELPVLLGFTRHPHTTCVRLFDLFFSVVYG